MVESTQVEGDGVNRTVEYAAFRTDKEAAPGHSRELISNRVDPKYYDDLDGQPRAEDNPTILHLFKRNLKLLHDQPFLGSRFKDAEGNFGDYQW
jgi:hypothetical protein